MALIFHTTIFILLFLTSCSTNSASPSKAEWQFISGRNEEPSVERPQLYRALVPPYWVRRDPPANESIADTTKCNCEFYIQEDGPSIRLTVHTFPCTHSNMRIPPEAQIARWKKQFEELNELATHVQPNSHGGFSGLFFEAEGLYQGCSTKVMGWSMQLASVYDRSLSLGKHSLDHYKRADYTIKASGPPALIDKHRSDILAFAHSFELIDELPSP